MSHRPRRELIDEASSACLADSETSKESQLPPSGVNIPSVTLEDEGVVPPRFQACCPAHARPAALDGIGEEGQTASRIKSEEKLSHTERDALQEVHNSWLKIE
ncbi:hypothetical protein NQZ68_014475 [Dissostichus eleginoides]|nr:hypothetical protein NQZ68_014475 [Dissostichus eleginoides]